MEPHITYNNLSHIEEMIDATILRYIKYSKNIPMFDIMLRYHTWKLGQSKDTYQTSCGDEIILLAHLRTEIKRQSHGMWFFGGCYPEACICYMGKQLMIYGTMNEPLFDIHQVIKLFDFSDEGEAKIYNENEWMVIYKDFKRDVNNEPLVKKFISEPNMYGGFRYGYIIREFITEENMYSLVELARQAGCKHLGDFKGVVGVIMGQHHG